MKGLVKMMFVRIVCRNGLYSSSKKGGFFPADNSLAALESRPTHFSSLELSPVYYPWHFEKINNQLCYNAL